MSNRYEISRLIGKGRTGGVYEAYDSVLNRPIALRRFFSEHGNSDMSDYSMEFQNLHAILTTWKHPNLATVFSGGVDQDGAYIASEFVHGKLLESRLDEGRFGLREFFEFAINILEGLQLPHAHNFAHGGLNTNSIMLEAQPQGGNIARIIDLGLAHMIPLINPENFRLAFSDPALMAPELFEGQMATPASDVYMCGNLFYLCLAGGHPLSGLPLDEAYDKHAGHSFAPVTGYRTSCPPQIAQWIEMLTQPNPLHRPQSASDALAMMPNITEIAPEFFESEGLAHTTQGVGASYYGAEQGYVSPPTSPMPTYLPPASTPSYSQPTNYAPVGGAFRNRQLPKVLESNRSSSSATPIVICVVIGLVLILALSLAGGGGKNKVAQTRTKNYSHEAETFNERFKSDSDSQTNFTEVSGPSDLDRVAAKASLEDPDFYNTGSVVVDPLSVSSAPKIEVGSANIKTVSTVAIDNSSKEIIPRVPEITLEPETIEFESADIYEIQAPADKGVIAFAKPGVKIEFNSEDVVYRDHNTLSTAKARPQSLDEPQIIDWMVQNGEDLISYPDSRYKIERIQVGEFGPGKKEHDTTNLYRSKHFITQRGGYGYRPYTGFKHGCGIKYSLTVPTDHVGSLSLKIHSEEVGLELLYVLTRSSKTEVCEVLLSEKTKELVGHIGVFELTNPQAGEQVTLSVLSNNLSTNSEDFMFGTTALLVLNH